ncbi:MAG TPA: hypothetical protein VGF48_06885 [Thermoanaerobaculia bacterium]
MILELSAEMREGFATVEQRLGARIDGVEQSLGARIDGVEQSLGARIDGVEQSLGARIDGVEHSLGKRIDSLDGRMDSLDARMDHLGDQLSWRMDSIDGKFQELNAKMDRQYQGLRDEFNPKFDLLAEGLLHLNDKIGRETADIRHRMDGGFAETHNLIRLVYKDLAKP